jgi:hypothetical protein
LAELKYQTNVCKNKFRHFWQHIKIKNNGIEIKGSRSCKKYLVINSKIDEEGSSPIMLAGLGSKRDSIVGISSARHKHGGGQFAYCRLDLVKPVFKTLSFMKGNVLNVKIRAR